MKSPKTSPTKNTLKISNRNSVNRKSIVILFLISCDFVRMKWLNLLTEKKPKYYRYRTFSLDNSNYLMIEIPLIDINCPWWIVMGTKS